MCDRTGFVDNNKGFLFSAQKHFPEFLLNSGYFDIIILAIGTNDLQFQYDINFDTIETGLKKLILTAKNNTDNVIIIPSVILSDNILNGYFKIQFDETSIIKSQKMGTIYKKLADLYNCKIFDINEFAKPSDIDGLHYNETSHKLIADKLEFFIKENYFI